MAASMMHRNIVANGLADSSGLSSSRRACSSSSSSSGAAAAAAVRRHTQHSRRGSRGSSVRVRSQGGAPEVNYDPENLFKALPPKTGLIERRMMSKQMQTDEKFAAAVNAAQDEDRKKVLLRRQSRNPPEDHVELVEFFLNTQADDMEFEVARCRPQLTPEFFKQLDTMVGQERFSPAGPDEDRLAELETLRTYLDEAVAAVDVAVAQNISAVERMKKLLGAKDKKEAILQMAEANEIDAALLDLLLQNIQAAREAGQEEPAKFMEKVRQAAMKFMVTKA